MNRENPRITTAAAAAIAVFAVSGPVGPFGTTAYGQQPADQTDAPERVGTNQENAAVRKQKTLSIPAPTERVPQQGSYDIRRGIERAGDSQDVVADEANGGAIERYANARTGDIRRDVD